MGQPVEDELAQLGGVLADAGGHHHGVGAGHGRVEAADGLLHPVHVHVDGQPCLLVARIGRRQHVAHVGRQPRHAEHAALAVQHGIHLVEGDALAAHDVGEDGRIDGAGARAHHEALQRREAHGGVDGLPVVDRRDGAAVAQMARDEPQIAQRATEQVRRLLSRVAVARAVGSVAADAVVVVVAGRQGVHVGLGRHRGVEGGVEDGDLGRVRHERGHHVDAGVGWRVMQRRQLLAQLKLLAGRLVDDHGFGEVLAAGHDAVADGVDLREVADGALRIVDEHFQKLLQALGHGHVRHAIGGLLEIRREGHVHIGVGRTHLLGQALHERHLAVGLDELALQRRRARIHYQYAHEISSLH